MDNEPVHSLRKNLFVRLLVMYHIVILPIVLLGLYLYIWSYNNASEEISKHTSIQLHSYLEHLDREIEWIEGQKYDLLHEDALRQIALIWNKMDGVEKNTHINYITNRLVSITNTSPYIEDIYIHIPSISKTISALNGVDDFNDENYRINQLNIQHTSRYIINQNDASLYLNSVIMNKDIDGQELYSLQIVLDKEELVHSLDLINMYEENETVLFSGDRQVLWASSEASEEMLHEYVSSVNDRSDLDSKVIEMAGVEYRFDGVYSEGRDLILVSYLPDEMVKKPLNIFRNWVWVFGLFTVIAIIIYSYFTYKHVHQPLLHLVDGFKHIEKGNLDQTIEHNKTDEFGFIYNRYNEMIVKLKTLIDRDYKQKLMFQKAELKQLQSQINPHFLYNSFFIINSLAKTEDTERIEAFTKMLGEYYKFITRNEDNLVPLVEEMKHARMYTDIQNMRFSRRIQVQFDELPESIEQMLVPKLIVQPIIENAYKYILEKMTQKGFLRITFQHQQNEVLIVVEDNGNVLSDEKIRSLDLRVKNTDKQQELSGLMNIHRRIELLYENGSGLFLSKSELNGLKVTIRLLGKEENKVV
ncbi:sensor histidine kinase [Alkalicoccobacillus porphyridii]|uniref:HAMP domain-containing protein n=1 Tax=Alkalicoccobacillus porphyridii TaxID=2597270 RepID=A0A554A2E5_9BACI|nr:histidine kinase [Alkalicoccobacillus porphyridii]TSB47858.1 HAMP domain-containing protein [Alkalicoccobacillus porphyridii]